MTAPYTSLRNKTLMNFEKNTTSRSQRSLIMSAQMSYQQSGNIMDLIRNPNIPVENRSKVSWSLKKVYRDFLGTCCIFNLNAQSFKETSLPIVYTTAKLVLYQAGEGE
jgi:hypothetical protein